MKTFKRISASISAQINSLVDQIENHEAVANVALHDIRESLMKAKFQIRRVQNERQVFDQRLRELKNEEQKWTERALQSQKEQQTDRALECVRRLKKAREDRVIIEQQLVEHAQLERQLSEDVRRIEGQFEELKRKRNLLLARESRSQAIAAVAEHQSQTGAENVFDRWEQKILRNETEGESISQNVDTFATSFNDQEERQALEALLNELSQNQSSVKNS